MTIKKLYTLVEMAAQGEHGGSAEAVYSGQEKIKLSHFYDCLQDVVRVWFFFFLIFSVIEYRSTLIIV